MKILLPIDGSPPSWAAVDEVCRRPWPAQTQVRLMTVDAPLDVSLHEGLSPAVYDELMYEQRADAQQHLNEAATLIRTHAPQLHLTPILREGRVKDSILDEAEEWGADLIVLGSHGYGALRRLFLGSVALAIATQAQCSVEIVRRPKAAGGAA